MLRIPQRVLASDKGRRSSRKSLRAIVEHCRRLLRKGRGLEALKAARQGLGSYPHAVVLHDIVRSTWKLMGREETEKLRRAVEDEPGPETWDAWLDHLVEHGDFEAAGDEAQRMLAANPQQSWSLLLHGATHLLRFEREKVADDGTIALASLKHAVELAPEEHDHRFLLIEFLERIGAVTAALNQVYLGQEEPGAPGRYQKIEARLCELEPEMETEGELLRRIEEGAEPEPVEPEEADLPGDFVRALDALSAREDVVRVVARHAGHSHHSVDGEGGAPEEVEDGRGFEALLRGFSRSASLSAKRMGIGSFQEAELVFGPGSVLAFQAGETVLMLERQGKGASEDVREEARMLVASWAAEGR